MSNLHFTNTLNFLQFQKKQKHFENGNDRKTVQRSEINFTLGGGTANG